MRSFACVRQIALSHPSNVHDMKTLIHSSVFDAQVYAALGTRPEFHPAVDEMIERLEAWFAARDRAFSCVDVLGLHQRVAHWVARIDGLPHLLVVHFEEGAQEVLLHSFSMVALVFSAAA